MEAIGRYGGTFNGAASAPWGGEHLESAGQGLLIWPPDSSVLYPNVIRGFEVAGDGRSVTFYLREGMKWSDGDDFDATISSSGIGTSSRTNNSPPTFGLAGSPVAS